MEIELSGREGTPSEPLCLQYMQAAMDAMYLNTLVNERAMGIIDGSIPSNLGYFIDIEDYRKWLTYNVAARWFTAATNGATPECNLQIRGIDPKTNKLSISVSRDISAVNLLATLYVGYCAILHGVGKDLGNERLATAAERAKDALIPDFEMGHIPRINVDQPVDMQIEIYTTILEGKTEEYGRKDETTH